MPGETVELYAGRLEEVLQILKNKFSWDTDEEDGFATGAVVDVIYVIKELRNAHLLRKGHLPEIIAILEDDDRRTEAMRDEIQRSVPQMNAIFFDNAPAMLAWLKVNLSNVRLLCLDHDLGPNRQQDGQVFDPGIGRDVTDFLVTKKPSCPVLIHSSNFTAASGMENILENAGWTVERIAPFDDLKWIKTQWSGRLEALLNRLES